jgi:hypothetical protein
MKARTGITCIILFIVLMGFINFDGIVDQLKKQLWAYTNENTSTNLYLHLDKNNYTPDEEIWFKAYILSGQVGNKVLFVRLTDQNKKIILTDQFPVYDIRSHGEMMIPDSLKDGLYYLYAFTDQMINFNERDAFVQTIKIRRNTQKTFQAEASVADTTKLVRGGQVSILLKVKDEVSLLKNIKGEYHLACADSVIKSGKLTTNDFGEAAINFSYPNISNDKSLKVNVVFKRSDEVAEVNLNLRHQGNPVIIKMYPEGGSLIAETTNKVVFETTDINHNPVSAELSIKKGEQVVAHIKTNNQGIHVWNLKPENKTNYTAEAMGQPSSKIDLTGQIQPDGYHLTVKHHNNKLQVSIFNQGEDPNAILVLRSINELLWNSPLTIASGDSVWVDVPAEEFPKGVLSLAVFNQQGKPECERLFLNQPATGYQVTIKTDQQQYGLRKKVTANISITDAQGNPAVANFSVAAVEKSQIDASTYQTILNAYYYKSLDGGDTQLMTAGTADDLDNLLLTKHWWNNEWVNIVNYKPHGPIEPLKNTSGISGQVVSLHKKPVKLKTLTVFSKSGPSIVPLNADGTFYIPSENLIADRSETKYLIINDEFLSDYTVKFTNYDASFDERVKMGEALNIPEHFNSLVNFEENKPNFNRARQLKEVKIEATAKPAFLGQGTLFGNIYQSEDCSHDYVCLNNVLNCSNHHFGSKPIEGHVYFSEKWGEVIYHGCDPPVATNIALKGISKPNQFYVQDYDKEPSYEPELGTTVYWNPNVTTNKEGKASFSFFTSDVTGDFIIMAQGVEARTITPLYSTTNFAVK